MKKLLLLFTMLIVGIGSMWADETPVVVTFGNSTAISGLTTDAFNFGGKKNPSGTLSDGTSYSFSTNQGEIYFWAGNDGGIEGTWGNSFVIADINTTLATTTAFAASHFSANSSLKYLATGNGNSTSSLTLTFANKNEGDYITLYASLARRGASLDNFSANGLRGMKIQYARKGVSGYSDTQAFSTRSGSNNDSPITIVKITGWLNSNKSLTMSSTSAKNGWQMIAYKFSTEYPHVTGNVTRTDRNIGTISFSGGKNADNTATTMSITTQAGVNPHAVYQDATDQSFTVQPGNEITVSFSNVGWMHAYMYVDYDKDGQFRPYAIEESGIPTAGSEIVSYTYYDGKNSKGQSASEKSSGTSLPIFTIPSNLEPGTYRGRFKLDWAFLDPFGANSANRTGNPTVDNGGYIVDFNFNVLLNFNNLNSAISEAQSYAEYLGTGLGKYSGLTDEELSDVIETAIAARSSSSQSEIDAALSALNTELAKLTINQPEVGKTYAFMGIADKKQYIIGEHSTVEGKTNRLALSANPSGNSHIFTLIEGNKLQAYTNNCYIVNNAGYLNLGDENAEGVAFEFTPASTKGFYLLKFMNSTTARCPYSQYQGYIDGANWSADRGIDYQWEIIEIEPKLISNITYNYYIDSEKVAECVRECRIGEPYPAAELPSGSYCSSEYYSITTPEEDVPDVDGSIDIIITQNLPFTASPSFENAVWNVLKLKPGDFKYQYYEDGQTKIQQNASSHDYSDKYLFCFVGNIVSGFKIYNRLAGNNMILSATTTMTDHVPSGDYGDADPYAIMVEMSNGVAPEGNNTYWDITKSDHAANGFFLGQHGYQSQRLNKRNNALGFWSGGADAGSTFVVEGVTKDGLLTTLSGYRSLEQITLEDGVTDLVYPNEYGNNNFTPQTLNTAIVALGDITEESTFDEVKSFAGSDNFRIVKKFKELSDSYGAPLSVTYEHKRPYGTLIMPINFTCPEGWTRYCCSQLDGGSLVLSEYSEGTTKNVPFIIYAPDKTNHKYQFIGYQNGAGTQNVTSGCLTGVLADETTTVPNGSYVLAYDKVNEKQSFRKTNGTVICPKYKVYLTKPAQEQARDAFFFPDYNGDSTGLDELLEQTLITDGKYIRNGRVIIMKDGVKYNTNGQIIK